MSKYRLYGKCTIVQYCHVFYPQKTGLAILTRCSSRDNCDGHEITVDVDEIVQAIDAKDAIGGKSLTQYEYPDRIDDGRDGLEPTWCSTPICYEVRG